MKIINVVKKKQVVIKQFILYGIIGIIASTTDVIIFTLLSNNINIFISNAISVNTGITISFFANTFINFKKKNRIFKRFLMFFTVGYIGLGLSSLILFIGVDLLEIEKIYVKVFTVFFVAIVQFILNKYITFKEEKING
jgi:putative flippase GtrA